MTKEQLETLRKKTIKTCTFSVLISVLACIVPCFILKGMIDYHAKTGAAVSGAYMAAGIIAAGIIVVIAFVCVRTVTGALRALREGKKKEITDTGGNNDGV